VLLTAIVLDAVVLTAFAVMKWHSDPLIVVIGVIGMALVFLFVRVFLARNPVREDAHDDH
jgi:general stress protein CsbA